MFSEEELEVMFVDSLKVKGLLVSITKAISTNPKILPLIESYSYVNAKIKGIF